jgi:hypothetical protein
MSNAGSGANLVISHPFWMNLGLFWRVNPWGYGYGYLCGRVRVIPTIPAVYPCHCLVVVDFVDVVVESRKSWESTRCIDSPWKVQLSDDCKSSLPRVASMYLIISYLTVHSEFVVITYNSSRHPRLSRSVDERQQYSGNSYSICSSLTG